jgi:hypothetical protein
MTARSHGLVILISAWRDEGVLRLRVSHDAPGDPADVMCSSIEGTVDAVRGLLERWDRVSL